MGRNGWKAPWTFICTDAAHLPLYCFFSGTALGDPIEVGAATAVLIFDAQGRTLPLLLSAAKSRFGHAEPAAGSIGMAHAVAQIGLSRSNAIMGVAVGELQCPATACFFMMRFAAEEKCFPS